MSRSITCLVLLTPCLLVPIVVSQEEQAQGKVVGAFPGVALEGRDKLVAAIPVRNTGNGVLQNVKVTKISLPTGRLAAEVKLPINLGAIRAQGHATIFTTFAPGPFIPGKTYELTVEGTFTENGRQHPFVFQKPLRIPPAAPGSTKARAAAVAKKEVKGAPYPARRPNCPEDVNSPGKWTVPVGTFKAPGPRSKGSELPPRLKREAPTVAIFTNAALGINGSTINEPSGGVGGEVVFVTANWFAAYSTNNGSSFTQLNPTTIFPSALGGFCCDQVADYVPSIDRFIWVLQCAEGYRVAAASPAAVRASNGTAWTYWDISASLLGSQAAWTFPTLLWANSLSI